MENLKVEGKTQAVAVWTSVDTNLVIQALSLRASEPMAVQLTPESDIKEVGGEINLNQAASVRSANAVNTLSCSTITSSFKVQGVR